MKMKKNQRNLSHLAVLSLVKRSFFRPLVWILVLTGLSGHALIQKKQKEKKEVMEKIEFLDQQISSSIEKREQLALSLDVYRDSAKLDSPIEEVLGKVPEGAVKFYFEEK